MSDPETQMVPNPERRNLLIFAIALIGAGISGVMGYAIFGYAVGQALKADGTSGDGNWIGIGKLDDFSEGVPTQKNITVTTHDGWVNHRSEEAVWVVRNTDKVTVFTATCPHLGCKVNWQEQAAQSCFYCPCHASSFNVNGTLIKGAAARGLDTLDWRRQADGMIQVNFKRFKAIVAEKVELL
ncbi:MAG: ubiquinol-cytochrome c reductase iron-sulfur subunit [Blastocatellia bacterium]|nr:ubiquinol-cytochrome c reductase iron-sulfur subunit [Blastocatellia bacterium]